MKLLIALLQDVHNEEQTEGERERKHLLFLQE